MVVLKSAGSCLLYDARVRLSEFVGKLPTKCLVGTYLILIYTRKLLGRDADSNLASP